jgi:hypothetical protein
VGGGVALAQLTPLLGQEARGNNNAGERVGFSQVDQPNCLDRALYWPTPGTFHNLGSVPPLTTDQQTRAEAINNATNREVVGRNLTAGYAAHWQQDGMGGWTHTNLSSLLLPSTGWDLMLAYDINDSGWVVGWGTIGGNPRVLLPVPLPPGIGNGTSDWDGDGDVDVNDLLRLLAAWGPCMVNCVDCHHDINGDCQIGVTELLDLLAAWGPCTAPGGVQVAASVSDCMQMYSSPADQAACIEKYCEAGIIATGCP